MKRRDLCNRDLSYVAPFSFGKGCEPATPLQPVSMRVEGVARRPKGRGCAPSHQVQPLRAPRESVSAAPPPRPHQTLYPLSREPNYLKPMPEFFPVFPSIAIQREQEQ